GRVIADTVISCGNSCKEIKNALSTALGQEFKNHCRISENPYEKEGTSERIVAEIKNYLDKGPAAGKKFYDIPLPE
ncbi:MAG: UDP-N-acetylglucosamine 2-epimerase (hydrolyzing), partial [Butyrivibrio sp.]|nr:UDP-N-acetylglucosamine 2-epimerase (hydrolyzing) [Butyrivibrio sp.]